MKKLRWIFAGLIIFGISADLFAQEKVSDYNENSVKGIPKYEQFYRKRVWRRMDLNEKKNQAFFALNNEITKIMIDAVKAGVLQPYVNDSLKTPMTIEKFNENMKLPGAGQEEEDQFGGDSGGWGDTGGGWGDTGGDTEAKDSTETGPAPSDEFLPTQITLLEIMEDEIFDKRRSTLYYDIQSIKMIIPGNMFETGVYREVAVFKYKDLEKLFRSMPEDAIWFNRQNAAEHRNLADAFELRLFDARIIKIDNPRDQYIVDIYNHYPKEAIMASQWAENELMEMEHNLWEY